MSVEFDRMRTAMLWVILGGLTAGFAGCGEGPPSAVTPSAEGPRAPGEPTEGPEALKTTAPRE